MNFLAVVAGGELDNVWDKEIFVSAETNSSALFIIETILPVDAKVCSVEEWNGPLPENATVLSFVHLEQIKEYE